MILQDSITSYTFTRGSFIYKILLLKNKRLPRKYKKELKKIKWQRVDEGSYFYKVLEDY